MTAALRMLKRSCGESRTTDYSAYNRVCSIRETGECVGSACIEYGGIAGEQASASSDGERPTAPGLAVPDNSLELMFASLAKLAALTFNTPIARISLIDHERTSFHASVGIDAAHSGRNSIFDQQAILADGVFVIGNAVADERFRDDPLVTGRSGVRFYAGAPLIAPDGDRLGTISILDTAARGLTDADAVRLEAFAKTVMDAFLLRHHRREPEPVTTAASQQSKLLALAEDMAGVGTWSWDVAGDRTTWSDQVYRIHGYEPGVEPPALEGVLARYHPEDATRLAHHIRRAVAEGVDYALEARIYRPDGAERHVTARGACRMDADGVVTALVGTFQDVTDHVTAERFIRSLADNLPGMVGYWDTELRCSFANAAYEEWFGHSPTSMRSITLPQLLGPAMFASDEHRIRAALNGERQSFLRPLVKPCGETGYTHTHYVPDIDTSGRTQGFYVLVTDITALKEAEQKLFEIAAQREQLIDELTTSNAERGRAVHRLAERETEVRRTALRHKQLINGVRDYAIYWLDPTGHVESWNVGAQRMKGYDETEIVGQHYARFFSASDRAAGEPQRILATALRDGKCIDEGWRIRKDGSAFWSEVSVEAVYDDSGLLVGFAKVSRDVSEQRALAQSRKEAHDELLKKGHALSEANRLLLMAEELSQVGHWRLDVAGNTVLWSDVVCATHGYPAGYAPRLEDAIELYHPDDRPAVQDHVALAIASGKAFSFDARIIRSDGAVRQVMARGRTESDADGVVVGVFGVIRDETDAREADATLQETNRRLRDSNRLLTMAEAVGKLGHWRIDYRDGRMFWSDEIYRIYDFAFDVEPSVERALSAYHPADVAAVRNIVADARNRDAGYSSQARILRSDGSVAFILTQGEVEFDATGAATGLFGIVQDVTDRVNAEEQLRDSEARFRLLTEQASDMISLHDVSGKCLLMSPSVQTILGYEPAEVNGRVLSTLIDGRDHGVVAQLNADLAARPPGEVSTARFRMKRRDGSLAWMESAARIAEYRHQPCVIVVSRDVTDRVRVETELQAARVQAEGAGKAKSSFLANMSHEIRTPMNGVIGFTELLLDSSLTDGQRRQAEMIAESGRAMMRLLNDILDLSKVEAGQMTISEDPFDLRHTLLTCMKLVTPALERKGLAPRCEIAADLPTMVRGDGLRVRQILLNVLGNAAKFTADGSVTLRASATAAGSAVLIEVADTGIGITLERQASVFEQFVQADSTISPRFGGTGLGLAISKQLADLMGGSLRLESEPGRGTTLFLQLPLVASSASRIQTPALPATASMVPPARPASAQGRVLVAEDHDVNRLLMSAMLDRLGYAYALACDGGEALAMIAEAKRSGRPFSIVLMDMQMPNMDGLTATRRIRESGLGPSALPIVALTANAYADDIGVCLAAGMQAHLAKPISLGNLDTALRRWAIVPGTPAPVLPFNPAIHELYRARRIQTLDAVGGMVRDGRFGATEVAEVADMLHKLAGTAAMFGEGALGDAARALEAGLHGWPVADRPANVAREFEAMQFAASR